MAKGGFGTFILGTFFGGVLTIGAIAGAGYWAYKSLSVEKVEGIIGQEIGVDEKLKKLTLADLTALATDVATNPQNYTLKKMAEDFSIPLPYTVEINGVEADISVFVDELYNANLQEALDNGVENVKNKLTFGNVKNVFGEALSLPDLRIFTSYRNTSVLSFPQVLSTLKVKDCLVVEYDGEGNEVALEGLMAQLGDLEVMELTKEDTIKDFVFDLTIDEIYEFDGSETGIVAAIKDLKVSELSSNDALLNAIGDSTLGSIMNLNATSGFGEVIKDWKIDDIRTQSALQAKLNTVKLGDIVTIGNQGFLAQIANWTLEDVTEDNIMGLKLGDVLSITANDGILAELKGLTLNQLKDEGVISDKVQNMTIFEVLPSGTVYESGTILYALKDTKINQISARLDTLKVSEIIPEPEGGYQDVMKYLIDPANGKDPLVSNLSTALETAVEEYVNDKLETMTIGELIDAGLLEDNGYSPAVKAQKAMDVLQGALDA